MMIASFDYLHKDRFQVLLLAPELGHSRLFIVEDESQQLRFGSCGVGHAHLEGGCAVRLRSMTVITDDGCDQGWRAMRARAASTAPRMPSV